MQKVLDSMCKTRKEIQKKINKIYENNNGCYGGTDLKDETVQELIRLERKLVELNYIKKLKQVDYFYTDDD